MILKMFSTSMTTDFALVPFRRVFEFIFILREHRTIEGHVRRADGVKYPNRGISLAIG